MCFKTAVEASSKASSQARAEWARETCPGRPLAGSSLPAAGIAAAFQGGQCTNAPQKTSREGQHGANPHSPALQRPPVLLGHGHPSPWAEEGVQSPDTAGESLAQGQAGSSLLLILTTSPAAKRQSFARAGCHLLEGRGLQWMAFRWGHIKVDRASHLLFI